MNERAEALKSLITEIEDEALQINDSISALLSPLPDPLKTHISQIIYSPNPVPTAADENEPKLDSIENIRYLNDAIFELECTLKDRDRSIAKLKKTISELRYQIDSTKYFSP